MAGKNCICKLKEETFALQNQSAGWEKNEAEEKKVRM